MNIETLYDYLKLLVPSDYTVTLKQNYISVVGCNNLLDSVTYAIEDNYIVLSTLLIIPEYAKVIFGEPVNYKPTSSEDTLRDMLTKYYFNIPEGLEDES